jgi:hypothetical protein
MPKRNDDEQKKEEEEHIYVGGKPKAQVEVPKKLTQDIRSWLARKENHPEPERL